MPREKLYPHRFNFMGSIELSERTRALAGRLGVPDADVLREALAAGLDTLEGCARFAHGSRALDDADQVITTLLELGDHLSCFDPDCLTALADLDVDVLKALRGVDPAIFEALGGLDPGTLVELESSAGELLRRLDGLE